MSFVSTLRQIMEDLIDMLFITAAIYLNDEIKTG